jgi:hypothetical protein
MLAVVVAVTTLTTAVTRLVAQEARAAAVLAVQRVKTALLFNRPLVALISAAEAAEAVITKTAR